MTVSALVTNRGTVNGSARITIYVNGEQDQSYGVSVNSGKSTRLEFAVSREMPGTYSVYVNGAEAGSFKVENAVNPDLILLISCVLIITALIMGVVYIRRKQQDYY